jgi:hypothetical protein
MISHARFHRVITLVPLIMHLAAIPSPTQLLIHICLFHADGRLPLPLRQAVTLASLFAASLDRSILEYAGAQVRGFRAASRSSHALVGSSTIVPLEANLRYLAGTQVDVDKFCRFLSTWEGPIDASCEVWPLETTQLGSMLRLIVKALWPRRLRLRSLAVNDLSQDVAKSMGLSLRMLTELERVTLKGDQDAKILAKCIPKWQRLKSIRLTTFCIEDLALLSSALMQCRLLEEVMFKKNRNEDDDQEVYLDETLPLACDILTLPKIRRLHLRICGSDLEFNVSKLRLCHHDIEDYSYFNEPDAPGMPCLLQLLRSPRVRDHVEELGLHAVPVGSSAWGAAVPSIVEMKKLKRLSLDELYIEYDDLYPLVACKNLERLHLLNLRRQYSADQEDFGVGFSSLLKSHPVLHPSILNGAS